MVQKSQNLGDFEQVHECESIKWNMKFTEYTVLNTIAFDKCGSKFIQQSRDQLISVQLPPYGHFTRPENSMGYRRLIRIMAYQPVVAIQRENLSNPVPVRLSIIIMGPFRTSQSSRKVRNYTTRWFTKKRYLFINLFLYLVLHTVHPKVTQVNK
jgi:hypothetical protein